LGKDCAETKCRCKKRKCGTKKEVKAEVRRSEAFNLASAVGIEVTAATDRAVSAASTADPAFAQGVATALSLFAPGFVLSIGGNVITDAAQFQAALTALNTAFTSRTVQITNERVAAYADSNCRRTITIRAIIAQWIVTATGTRNVQFADVQTTYVEVAKDQFLVQRLTIVNTVNFPL
jgi:hypothetical protein